MSFEASARRRHNPKNIQDRIKQDGAEYHSQQMRKEYQTTRHTEEWYRHLDDMTHAKVNQRINKEIMDELRMANTELKERRRAKLKELYDREQQEYELELQSKGLAVYKRR